MNENFRRAGASHILAVSGLHVNIIIMMFTFFLNFLFIKKSKTSSIVKTILILIFVWTYSFVAGLAPSIVRAATMFSLYAVVSLFTNRRIQSSNIVSLTALGMLAYNPHYLFDIGFQLSFTAVASILMFYKYSNPVKWLLNILYLFSPRTARKLQIELYNFPSTLKKDGVLPFFIKTFIVGIARIFISSIRISIAAQILILPLLIYYFHSFSLIFIASSVCIIPLATILIPLSFLFLLSSMIFTSGVIVDFFATLTSFIARLIIDIVDSFAKLEGLQFSQIPFNIFDLVFTSAIILLLYAFLKLKTTKCAVITSSLIVCYTLLSIYQINKCSNTNFLAVFNISGTSSVTLYQKGECRLYAENPKRVIDRVGSYLNTERVPTPVTDSVANAYYIGDSLIYILAKQLPKDSVQTKLNVNTLVVQRNAVKNINDIDSFFNYEHLVVDATNSWKVSNQLKAQRDSLRLNFHICKIDGSYLWKYE